MPIKLDEVFETSYRNVKLNKNDMYIYFFNYDGKYTTNEVIDVFNILTTSDAISSSYSKVERRLLDILPDSDTKYKDVVVFTLLFMRERHHQEISKYIKRSRNIEYEVAANLFGEPVSNFYNGIADEIESKIANMKTIGGDVYNVEETQATGWDEYYFDICLRVSRNSKCFSRKIGAILVKDKIIISTGYNGAPRGIPTCDYRWVLDRPFQEKFLPEYSLSKVTNKCPRKVIGLKSGEGLELCPALHAEENTIINCARMGIEAKDTIMYMTCGIPCSKCMIKIINAGVKELVVTKYSYYDETTKYLLENSEVKVRLYDFLN